MRRAFALLIVALALGGLFWQFEINAAKPGLSGVGIRLWLMLRYFTNFANLLVAVTLGFHLGRNWQATATLAIVMVGLVYHFVLALPQPMPAPHWYPDFLLHRAVPVLTLVWWLIWGAGGLRLRALPLWLLPPVLYGPYALIRGAATGIYPYPFLDLSKLSGAQVAVNLGGILLGFALGGVVIWGIGISRRGRLPPEGCGPGGLRVR